MIFEWELIYSYPGVATNRARVFGGWLVNNATESPTKAYAESMVFVPDPDYNWILHNG